MPQPGEGAEFGANEWLVDEIYEQFLGKVIVATDQRAHVEEKPEVRKAGGVDDPLLRQRVAAIYCEAEILRLIRLRTVSAAVFCACFAAAAVTAACRISSPASARSRARDHGIPHVRRWKP